MSIRLPLLLLALCVLLGAFGAHALKDAIDNAQLNAWHKAVEYQFYHSIGLLLLTVLEEKMKAHVKRIRLAKNFLLAGIVCFCGSLYFLSTQSLTGIDMNWLEPVTPIGGAFFIAGWLLAAFSFSRKKCQ